MIPGSDHHDIVVIGASAGGVDALTAVVGALPADLPAAVFVVIHVSSAFGSGMPDLLTRRGDLRASHAVHGEAIVPGRVYVAPPDNHLMVRQGYVQVVRGPKENGHRPAVDALFRTASRAYGPRVVGVVLTGHLDCGTAGLLSIKARGGIAVVQDPKDAAAPDMPRSAIAHVDVDYVAPLRDIPGLIEHLVRQRPAAEPAHLPGMLAELEGDEPGSAAELVCPICHGTMTETNVGNFQSFRCHVGHSFSAEAVSQEQAESVERALWAAVRALDESAELSGRLAVGKQGELRRRFAEREESQHQHAELIRRILLSGPAVSAEDVARAEEEGAAHETEGHPIESNGSGRPGPDPPAGRG